MKNTLTMAIGKMRNRICFIFVVAVLFAAPVAVHAALLDEEPAPPVSKPIKNDKVETECPPGSFKFDGTGWVQGDCPEGQALFRQGVCAPIPNWQYTPPEEDQTAPPPQEAPKQNP